MAYRKGRGSNNKRVVMIALGGLVAMVLALWIFDQVLDAVAPLWWTCSGGYTRNDSTGALGTASTCYEASNVSNTTTATSESIFSTTGTFIQAILPVIGIVGAYIIIKYSIKKLAF